MRDFEITMPRFSTSDEDQIHLLLKDAQFHGAYGTATYGHPKSIVTSPKIRTLLRKFHGEASEDSEDSDGDVSSQGGVAEASQSLFATQGPFSQLPVLRNRKDGAATKTPIIKSEPGEQTSAKGKVQPKPADSSKLLALLKQPRSGPMNETMPPLALPKIASQHADSATSQSKSQIPKANPRQDVAEEEHEEEDVVVMHTEEDASGLTGLDEEINGTINSGESKDPVEQPNPDKDDAPRDPKVSAESQVSKGPADNNNTPTSYQIPVVSSSTVLTTNSSLPSVLPTVEKVHSTQASSKCERRFFHHPRWNCVLPATRSASKIPQDQEEILKKPSSIFPAPVGFHYPVANVPNHILTTLTARLEEQKQRLHPPENSSPYQEDQSAVVENAPSSPATADAVVGVVSSPPTEHYPWSSSPVRTMKRQADLPPDSSFPEEQYGEERDVCPQTRGTESSHHPTAEIPSSPPRTVSKAQSQEDPTDDDSDLETSVPMPLSYRKRSLQGPVGEVGDTGSRKNKPLNQMSRHVSSSGKPYTHLHLPEITRPLQVTASSISGRTLPMTQPPQPSPHEEHHASSSAPVIPCSYEVERTTRNITQRVVTFDGAAESKMASFPDQEDAVERQIQNEQFSRSSHRRSLASPSLRNQHSPTSPTVRHGRASQNRNSSAEGSPAHHRPKDPPIKREAQSPSPPPESRKRAKKSGTTLHFSQDAPVSQEPLTSLHEQRRKFHNDGGFRAIPRNVPGQRRISNSSASDQAGSDAGISSTHSPNSPSSRAPIQVKKEPAEEDPHTTRGSRQPSASATERPTSSGEGSSTVVAKAPTKVKTEVVEEDDPPPLSPVETGVIQRPASHDGMDIDIPAEAQPQVSRIGSSTTEAQQANVPESISHVKETLPHDHLNPHHVETQDSPQAALGIPDRTPAPGDPVPSLAKEKSAPATDPLSNAATDAPVNPPGDVDTIQPPPNAVSTERTTSMPTTPPCKNPDMTEPSSTFDQFSHVYPEYTGNRKHFENLCGQLEWLRKQDRGLHPFLWDDYIIRSRTDYRKYTEECGDEGIDPLPWHKYYVESIPVPRFIKGVMNPVMLEKFFAEQGRPLRPIIHSNISRMEHVPEMSLPPTFSPSFDSAPGGRDNHRPKKPKRQKRKNGNLQQGVVGSPLRHNANQMPAPWTTTPLPVAAPSSASNHAQTAATSTTAEPFPQKPPQPAPPAPATRPPPKPPAPTAHQLTVRGAQNNPRPPPTSGSAARSALVASSTRAASVKPPPAPRPATSGPQQTAAAGAGSAAKGLPTTTNPNNKRKRDGDGSPPPLARPASSSSTTTAKATKEKRPNGMPAPPPPDHSTSGGGGGSGGGGAKGNKPRKTMFTIYKERRKAENSKKSTPGGSRAGSVV